MPRGKYDRSKLFQEDVVFLTGHASEPDIAFKTQIESAEFLGCSITKVKNAWRDRRRLNGYLIRFKVDGACEGCGVQLSKKSDSYCSTCYTIEVTGEEPKKNSGSGQQYYNFDDLTKLGALKW